MRSVVDLIGHGSKSVMVANLDWIVSIRSHDVSRLDMLLQALFLKLS